MKNGVWKKGLCSRLEGILAGVRLVWKNRGISPVCVIQLNPAAGLASWQLWFRAMRRVMGLGPHFFKALDNQLGNQDCFLAASNLWKTFRSLRDPFYFFIELAAPRSDSEKR